MTSATRMAPQTGMTAEGNFIIRPAMTTAKTALTISSSRKITIMKMLRARVPTTSPVSAPTDLALLRTLAQIAPASWTPAKKIVPKMTHRKAGTQPQMTAMAGPTMGAAPATEVKWWPHST